MKGELRVAAAAWPFLECGLADDVSGTCVGFLIGRFSKCTLPSRWRLRTLFFITLPSHGRSVASPAHLAQPYDGCWSRGWFTMPWHFDATVTSVRKRGLRKRPSTVAKWVSSNCWQLGVGAFNADTVDMY